jgi:REP element-mobilizing transposase RayT
MIGMGRRPRIHYPGAVYHVMARGVDGRAIYTDDIDRLGFMESLERIGLETGASILAYCLMGNHFHLAIKVGSVPLASVLQRILTSYSITFNRRHGRTGHLFQARYKSLLCADDSYLVGLIRYIHMNPVRAGLVLRPEDWAWSSHLGYRNEGRDGLISTEEDIPDFDPWPTTAEKGRPILIRQLPKDEQDLSHFAALISTRTGISVDELRSGSRRRDVVNAKKRFVHDAVTGGHRLTAIANWLGLTSSALTRYTRGKYRR